MSGILNVAAYRFVDIDDGPALREQLLASAGEAGLKGTVLLAPEGINFFLAGPDRTLEPWLLELQADSRFDGLELKRSRSAALPFRHLRVKLKREIIRMNTEGIRPGQARAPVVSARTLATWLQQGHDDQGRPVKMLDTRNGFEVDEGAFEGAIDWRLHKFSDFPAELERHRDDLAGATIVSYCTGGIRCEKAALLMRERGMSNVYQLDGGILKYFEDTDSQAPGWRGRCFVFDERVALNPALEA